MSRDPSDLVNISTGKAPSNDVVKDLLGALVKGETAYTQFETERMLPGHTKAFHDPIHRLKLQTFGSMKDTITTKTKTKEAVLKADHRVFGQMVLIAKNRNLDMAEVLQHPLGPLPWSLANADSTVKKTNKAALARELEKKVAPVDTVEQPSAPVFDAMAVLQKMHGEGCTFEDVSDLNIY